MAFFERHVFFYRGYMQGLFFLALVLYVWLFPRSGQYEDGWLDTMANVIAVITLILGELIRIWAVSHAGKCTRSRHLKAPVLVTTGPYAFVRHPIYIGNFLIGLGMVLLSEALVFIPVFLLLFVCLYDAIVSEEEKFLSQKFGAEFERYRSRVPKYFPLSTRSLTGFSLGKNFPLKELGTAWGIIVGALFFEWIKSPLHRQWVFDVYNWLTTG
jgi:protein-S-isoprenylcysteine O-methyltransferase Ste14